jgi:hypothetical protein
MTVLRPNPVNAAMFMWNAEDRTYFIDMSQLGGFGRVYDDACDEGLTLVERHGLREVVCVVEDQKMDRDNDITMWVLKPVRPYKGPPFTIKVFNT